MNFDEQIYTLLNWQEERENQRCYIYLAADAGTGKMVLNCHAGGRAINLASSLAAMLLDVPALKNVLEGALGISKVSKIKDGLMEASEENIKWEIRAAQEGESYSEEKKLNEYNNEQES